MSESSERPITTVFGISGFVGSHVAAALLDAGHDVRGTLRDPSSPKAAWIQEALGNRGGALSLHAAALDDAGSVRAAMEGASGVIMSAGTEKQEPATVELMVGAANNVLDAALELGIGRAVFTSSTGSTNPPGGDPELKSELEHWSDPDAQEAAGKFSPAAKTRMEKTALAHMEASEGKLRVAIFCPSGIVGPAFQPEPPGALRWIQAILAGQRMGERAPNGSMSFIDVRDLARLHVAALESEEARGRYFGVKRSWHWQDILEALGRAYPAYTPPSWPADEERARPTQFDLSRRDSLGVEVRDLDAMMSGIVDELRRRDMLPGG